LKRATVAVALAALAGCSGPGTERLPTWTEPVSGIELVRLPAGEFEMGSPPGEPGHEKQERRHRVALTRSFWIGRTEVSQAEWVRVMGVDPSLDATDLRRPVENVNVFEVEAFVRRLNALSPGETFRLPTEAEWEYACRAGTTSAYPTGRYISTDEANYDGHYPLPGQGEGEFRDATAPVGSFPPNPWGLHDLNGNVWEWTADEHCPYPDDFAASPAVDPVGRCGAALRVIRGGSYLFNADSARCAVRYTHRPIDRGPSLGFRLVREEPPVAAALP